MVLSIWREGRCLGTFHAPDTQVAALLAAIEWAAPSGSSHGTSRPGAAAGTSGLVTSPGADATREVLASAPVRQALTPSPGRVLAPSRADDRPSAETPDGPRSAGTAWPARPGEGSRGLREAARDLDEALRALEAAAPSVAHLLAAGSKGPVPSADATAVLAPVDADTERLGSPQPVTAGPADATRLLPAVDAGERD